ncbi:uncharacterized protein TNCV_2837571 [Trichonephila clavipes]|nr:uncharacterized protein TNCV_2837571 [Trichonephila clavipes]
MSVCVDSSLSARSTNLPPTENVCDIIGQQLQHHPHPALIITVLTQQVQQAWNSIPHSDIRHLYDTLHARFQAYIQSSGDGEIPHPISVHHPVYAIPYPSRGLQPPIRGSNTTGPH